MMGVDPKKGKTLYVVRAVCQKQRISFDNLCEFMVDGHRKPDRCCSRFLQVPDNIEYALFARQDCRRRGHLAHSVLLLVQSL